MIGSSGIIYDNNSKEKISRNLTKNVENLDGNSGVGQAFEFPSKSSRINKSYISSQKRKIHYLSSRGLRCISEDVAISLRLLRRSFLTSRNDNLFRLFFLFAVLIIFIVAITYFSHLPQKSKVNISGFAQVLDSDLQNEIKTLPNPDFSLVIPKLNLMSQVFPNVDSSDQAEYGKMLLKGVVHAKDSKFPGQKGTVFLFAHSTQDPIKIVKYHAVFSHLKDLEINDGIFIYYNQQKYKYLVTEKKVVLPQEIEYLVSQDDAKERLILQTCDPPGSNEKRLLIIAER